MSMFVHPDQDMHRYICTCMRDTHIGAGPKSVHAVVHIFVSAYFLVQYLIFRAVGVKVGFAMPVLLFRKRYSANSRAMMAPCHLEA